MKLTKTTPDKTSLKSILGLCGVTLLHFGLRIYTDFAATGTEEIAKSIVEKFSQPSQWHIFWAVSILLGVPFVATNALAAGLALALFFRQNLWKYGLAVGILSEFGWILIYCVYIMGHGVSVTNPAILVQELIVVLSPAIAASGVEKVCGIRGRRSERGQT